MLSLVLLTKQSMFKIMADASKYQEENKVWFITISSQKFTTTYPLPRLKLKAYFML